MKIKPDPYLKNLTCLYVEDEEDIREVFLILLNKIFKKVYIASNGKNGLDLYKEIKPDIVLSDIKMPEMNGLEMSKEIKKISPDSFIIILTAFTDLEFLKKAIDLELEGYITKPVDKKKLYQKLNFLAQTIKHKRESQEHLNMLKKMLQEKKDPVILTRENRIIIHNDLFLKEFGNFNTLDDLEENLKIDIFCSEESKKALINGCQYEIICKKIDEYKSIITFKNLEKDTKIFTAETIHELTPELINKLKCYIFIIPKEISQLNSITSEIKKNLRKNDYLIIGQTKLIIIPNDVYSLQITEKISKNIKSKLNYNYNIRYEVKCIKITDIKELFS